MVIRHFKRVRQMLFSSIEAFAVPLVMLVATPILLKALGEERFGVWVLINSVAAFTGFANFGFQESAITFGSKYIARDEKEQALDVYIVSILSCIVSITILLLLLVLLFSFFGSIEIIQGYSVATLSFAMLSGVFLFSLRLLERTVLSYFKVHLDYHLSSFYSFTSKTIGISGQVFLLVQGVAIPGAFLFSSLITLIFILIAGLHLSFRYQLNLKRKGCSHYFLILKTNFYFSFQSWIQSILAISNSNLDKILVGKVMGPVSLSYYSIGTMIMSQTHLLMSTGFQYTLPEFSALRALNQKKIISYYWENVALSVCAFLVVVIGLTIHDHGLLHWWLKGKADAVEAALPSFLIYEFCLLLNIIPYYLLLSFERVNQINQITITLFALLTLSIFFLVFGWELNAFILVRALFVLITTLLFHQKAMKVIRENL